MIPGGKRREVIRAVPEKDPQIMQPCGGMEHVIVKSHPLTQAFRKRVEARLVAEFIDGKRIGTDVIHNRSAGIG